MKLCSCKKGNGISKSIFLLLIGFIGVVFFYGCNPKVEKYKDTSLSFEERARELVAQMTLEEKVSQMQHASPAIERLGVPEYNWWNECLHGVARAGKATVFPQAIGMAAMWDEKEMFAIANTISDEARAKHHDFLKKGKRGIYQGLTFWSPNINIFRDPRWGRGMETYGEDPYLSGEMGVNFIRGLQGDNEKYLKLVATAKHFGMHSGPEPARHSFNVDVLKRDSILTYTPHFKKVIEQAGVYSVMCAYNRLNGKPCCGSKPIEDLLRKEWGLKGYIVSDCWAVADFYKKGHHELVATPEEAAAMAVKAGTDLNCGNTYPALVNAVKNGLVAEDEIDILVTRLMLARMKLGMFDPEEMVPYTKIPYSVVESKEHQQQAYEAAQKSMVLLKNDNHLLPLKKDLKKVAVIGPNANNIDVLLANYNGYPSNPVTPLQGIKKKLPDADVEYAMGCPWVKGYPNLTPINECLFTSELMDKEGLVGKYYNNGELKGEPLHTRVDKQVNFVWADSPPFNDMDYDHFSVKWTGYLVPKTSGEYYIGGEGFSYFKLSMDNNLIAELQNDHHPQSGFDAFDLEAGEKYKIDIEFKQKNTNYPLMKLFWEMPHNNLQQEAVALAKKSDAVFMFMGLSPRLEGEEMDVDVPGFYGGDRSEIALPKVQTELIKEIMAVEKPTVLILLNGSALAFNWEAEHVPAIIEAWYPGQAAGTAIADVLFGDYNPAGRLPVTFYKSVNQLPPFDDYSMDDRTYQYFKGEPLYPFGYGLSYTTFEYTGLNIKNEILAGENVQMSVEVANTGKMDGDEVVQLYVSHPHVKNSRLCSLQGFERVSLKVGEKKTVTFTLNPEQLAVYDNEEGLLIPEGEIKFTIGGCSPNFSSSLKGKMLEKSIQVEGVYYIE